MAELTFIEKLSKLISNFNGMTVMLMLLSIILMVIVYMLNNKGRKYSYLAYSLIIIICGFIFKNSLFNLIDMFIERMFYLFYFPTGAIYMITLVISHVIVIYSIGKKDVDKITKYINFTGFTLTQIICINILSYLSNNKVNLTNELKFINNRTMIGMLELSMLVFTLWMGILITRAIINALTYSVLSNEYDALKETEKETVLENTVSYQPMFNKLNNVLAAVKTFKPEINIKTKEKPIIVAPVEPIYNDNYVKPTATPNVVPNIVNESKFKDTFNYDSKKENIMDFLLKPQHIDSNKAEEYNIPTDEIINDNNTKLEEQPQYVEVTNERLNTYQLDNQEMNTVSENIIASEAKDSTSSVTLTTEKDITPKQKVYDPNKEIIEFNWSEGIVKALNIPAEPIINDVNDKLVIDNIDKETPLEETFLNTEIKENKPVIKKTNIKEMYQKFIHGENTDDYSLDDYKELRKYILTQK